jgi:hypothetical protein
MSQTIDQAEELRAKAISILLAERQQIDDTLVSLSYGAAQLQPKKSHKKKATGRPEVEAISLETPV